jgi:hypothetical protein
VEGGGEQRGEEEGGEEEMGFMGWAMGREFVF